MSCLFDLGYASTTVATVLIQPDEPSLKGWRHRLVPLNTDPPMPVDGLELQQLTDPT